MTAPELAALDDFPPMEAGAPAPAVLADEHRVLLSYARRQGKPAGDCTEVIAMLSFEGVLAFQWGPPNDEMLESHRLSRFGLGAYGAYEVQPSDWLSELERRNRAHPRHADEHFQRFRHFVLTFHDSTFEILARSWRRIGDAAGVDQAIASMARELRTSR